MCITFFKKILFVPPSFIKPYNPYRKCFNKTLNYPMNPRAYKHCVVSPFSVLLSPVLHGHTTYCLRTVTILPTPFPLFQIQGRTLPPNQTAPSPTPRQIPPSPVSHPTPTDPSISFSSQNAIVLNQDDQQINCYIHVCVIAPLIGESSKSQTAERGQAVIDGGREG